jgi:hypothetical protein
MPIVSAIWRGVKDSWIYRFCSCTSRRLKVLLLNIKDLRQKNIFPRVALSLRWSKGVAPESLIVVKGSISRFRFPGGL